MPNTQPFQNNFTSGEINRALNGRLDVKQYRNGAYSMVNALPALEGGFTGRPGLRFLHRLRNQTEKARFIPFEFSVTQAYLVIVNDGYMWFDLNRVLLTETVQNVEDVTLGASSKIRITITGHGYTTGDWVQVAGVTGSYQANSEWAITVIDANNFDLDGSTFSTAYLGQGTVGKIVEVACPYTEADLESLRWTQDGDVLYLVSGTYINYKLSRTSATTFTLEKFFTNGPYQEVAYQTSATTMNWSSATLTVGTTGNMIASAPTFAATDVDRVIKYEGDVAGVQGYLKLTAFNSTTDMSAEVMSELSGTTATTNWSLGVWNQADGWPTATTFHEQRLLMGSTASFPQTWWGSFLNAPADFVGDDPTANDDSYSYKVRSEKNNIIKWMASLDTLLIGTAGEEYKVIGPTDTTIGPVTRPLIKPQTKHGTGTTPHLVIEDVVMYMQWGERRLYTLEFDPNADKLTGQDLTFISRHLVPDGTKITRLAYEEQPNNVVWAIRDDGVMLSMLYFPEQEVLGWSQHTTTDGLFEEVVSLPNVGEGVTDTYVVVKRTVNGAMKRYVEYFDRDLYVDSGLSGTFATPQSTINGFNHLIGESITTQIDGGAGETSVVNALGQMVLTDLTATTMQGGLSFVPTVIPLEPAIESTAVSNSQPIGRKKKYGPLLIRTLNTTSLAVNGNTLPARRPNDLMDTSPPGAEIDDWWLSEQGYKTISSITITQPLPLPIHVLVISGTMSVGDK